MTRFYCVCTMVYPKIEENIKSFTIYFVQVCPPYYNYYNKVKPITLLKLFFG